MALTSTLGPVLEAYKGQRTDGSSTLQENKDKRFPDRRFPGDTPEIPSFRSQAAALSEAPDRALVLARVERVRQHRVEL